MTAARAVHVPNTAWFAGCAALVYAAAIAIVRSTAFAARPGVLAGGVAADLLVTVPALFWLLVIRPGHASWRSMLAVLALSVLGARLVLPTPYRGDVGLARFATAPIELALLGWAAVQVRRSLRRARAAGGGADIVETLERSLRAALGDRAPARVVAAEAATLYFGLGGGHGASYRPDEAETFSHADGQSVALLWGISIAVAVETGVLHLVLHRSHPALAWIATALSAYSVLWLVGHHRAGSRRRSVLEPEALVLRVGLRLSARVPLDRIAGVERATWRTRPGRSRTWLDAARPQPANVLVRLRAPTAVSAALGMRRTVTGIALRVDEPERFMRALNAAITT